MPPTDALLSCDVPILGQPMTVLNATLLPLVQCRCAAGGSVVLIVRLEGRQIGAMPGQCPSCGRVFLFRGLSFSASGQPEYAIEITEPMQGRDS